MKFIEELYALQPISDFLLFQQLIKYFRESLQSANTHTETVNSY